jgi:methylisocitrate lyase
MSWLLHGREGGQPARLKELLSTGKLLAAPGVFNPLSALLARQAGFPVLYLSGAALAASLGLSDLDVMTLDELAVETRAIVRAVSLPLIVDGDTGYGQALNVMRLTRELEEAGAAAIQIEDQEMPKRCGHLDDKHLVSVEEMLRRIEAVRRARRDLLIIARTDARGVTGMDDALARARAYTDGGADVIFPEGLESQAEFAAFRQALDVPLLANMTEFGKTPHLTTAQFQALGYNLVIYPVSALRLAAKAMAVGYAALSESGTLENLLPDMLTRRELYELLEYPAHQDMARSLHAP